MVGGLNGSVVNKVVRVSVCAAVTVVVALGSLVGGGSATADSLSRYLNLPLVNRDASQGPGGVHPALPTDASTLQRLVDQARDRGLDPSSYEALLFQYWLVETTTRAGIDLASWNPRDGVGANHQNLLKSYRYYEDLQLAHRELQWAGMGGLVGGDFGGGLLDYKDATEIFEFSRLQPVAHAIVARANELAGPQAVNSLPGGLRALARVGAQITADDLRQVQGQILVMQKNIFSDLMPMHRAYVVGGLPALREMNAAGLFDDEIMRAWEGIASKEPAAVAAGNARLLQREQGEVIAKQWDATRNYKGDVGEAMTYGSTVAAAPSVAGVVPPRDIRQLTVPGRAPDGRKVIVSLPLPEWNWSVYEDRWVYISTELLPKYRKQVEYNWPALSAAMRAPYFEQMETHRPTRNLLPLMQSVLTSIKVTYQ
ncbi:hypothetical protein BJF87_16205 [Gordonia sp. CNJ-863]|uniref:hypothetical protein n=1 Tax=Gordonia sp. CNJ-863 TaxID=1904963 RepID=UPI0009612157|nr:MULTISPECIES: hypothetical protein [Gordonia]MDH3046574.1 hypothetical protein [Gordonia alkanivorans]OLT51250.1 hypothetical protein BJF87_16205 [Gordonia sp. CNJ-863]